MDNKLDDEIEKWQNERKQKQIEKYGMDFSTIDISTNEKHRKKLEIFSRLFSFAFKTFSTINIGIAITIVVFAFVFIYALFSILAPKNVLKSLKTEYRNEKFVIIEDYGKEDTKSRGLYMVSPKSNPDIIFKMYNTTKVRSDNDYSDHRVKYYFEKCDDKELVKDFYVEEGTIEYEKIDFLHYTVLTSVNNYNEIEQKVKSTYKLIQYFLSQNNKMYEAIFIENPSINYHFYIKCDTTNSLEQEIYRAKYEYIRVLKESNSLLLNQIPEEELSKIWKPEKLSVYVNDVEVGIVNYDSAIEEYYIDDITDFLDKIDKVEVLKRTKYPNKIKKIKYNNKKYKVLDSESKKSNVLYAEMTLKEFCERLNILLDYDYNNQKIYLEMK